ncbi:MAG: bifunctional 23S rRNA (guanine(2069)-N(7))-methyltransferase RlmK/23S rRNA (guanine(2445)-N(2))-methyltransferase RlmL [Agarilytica sp.]
MKHDKTEQYFASCPKGIEELLRDELKTFGAQDLRLTAAGVGFRADKAVLYRTLLSTRFANRILWQLQQEKASTAQEIYSAVYQISWEDFLSEGKTFVVDFIGTNKDITNSQFGAMKVKDAIVDRFKKLALERPNVDKRQADVRINLRLNKGEIFVSLDMSGDSLHKRGYRTAQGDAPLKENLAAAILYRAGWPALVEKAEKENKKIALVDPMCGSGTFIIEGLMIAANYPPGLLRQDFSCQGMYDFDAELWHKIKEELHKNVKSTTADNFPDFVGRDSEAGLVNVAEKNIANTSFSSCVRFEAASMENLTREALGNVESGLLICNPPYGERLGVVETLREDYRTFGQVLKSQLSGWRVGILTSNVELAKEMRLRATNKYKFFNGKLPAELHVFEMHGEEAVLREERDLRTMPLSEGAQMVANRLTKNDRKLASWRKKSNISCYRLYDADMPEYAAAIDVYDGKYHIQEYQAPKSVNEDKARKRFEEVQHAVAQTFSLDIKTIACKTRKKQKGSAQYEKLSGENSTFEKEKTKQGYFQVQEGKANLEVNLFDYLDTGLFLDHRPLRRHIFESASGKSFLNLFCYTATATVQAILGGATNTVSVDMSNTYLDWARRNFKLNNIHSRSHELVRADCVEWLAKCRRGFDIIMLDPPSFSNSKFTSTVLDVQKDHGKLISRCVDLLNPGGVLYFSTNLRSFKLDPKLSDRFKVIDYHAESLDPDFERNKKIHYCWKITSA